MTVWWQLRPFLLIIGCSQVLFNGRFRRGIDAVESSAASIGTGGEEN